MEVNSASAVRSALRDRVKHGRLSHGTKGRYYEARYKESGRRKRKR